MFKILCCRNILNAEGSQPPIYKISLNLLVFFGFDQNCFGISNGLNGFADDMLITFILRISGIMFKF